MAGLDPATPQRVRMLQGGRGALPVRIAASAARLDGWGSGPAMTTEGMTTFRALARSASTCPRRGGQGLQVVAQAGALYLAVFGAGDAGDAHQTVGGPFAQ